MATKHTPGPWYRNIKPATKYPIIFAGRNTHIAVIDTVGKSEEEVEANINLALSAPQLLEALQAAYKFIQHVDDLHQTDYSGEPLQSLVEAAIAKATNQV